MIQMKLNWIKLLDVGFSSLLWSQVRRRLGEKIDEVDIVKQGTQEIISNKQNLRSNEN